MTAIVALPIRVISWFFILAFALSLAACSSPEDRARAHYESGKTLLDGGDFIKAGLEFRNALKYNDKLADAWFGLATVEEQKQNWPVVADSLQRVVELDPKHFEARLKLAKLQLAALKLELALKNINDADNLKKDDTDVFALRAAILFRLNDRQGARADAERALALDPDNPDAHAVLAADQMRDGNNVAALRFLDRGLVKDPNNLGLLMFKIKIFEDTKDDPKLEAVLRQVIAARPHVKEMRQALLAFLASRKRTADVETEMRQMLAADPADTEQALNLVRFVGANKGAAEARLELEKLVTARPEVVDYKLALAQLDFSEKKSDNATKSLEAIVAVGEPEKDVLRAKLLLANMSLQLGLADKAKTLINDVLATDEKNADALALRANLSLESGEVDSAVADLREALNQQPNSVPLLALLGRAHERQGSVDLANDRLAQAVKLSNYSPQIALDYMAFLGRRNKPQDAETILNEAVSHNPNDARLLQALAQLRLSKQDWVGAQAAAEALKKSSAASGVGDQILGAVLLGQKKYDESIEALKGAHTNAPNAVQPMYSLVVAYLQAGKTKEAEDFLQSILKANGNNADAHVLMGSLKLLQKLPLEAETSYRRAIESQPANPRGYIALSNHLFMQAKREEAEQVLRTGREKVPDDLGINLGLGTILETRHDVEGAIGVYEEQLKTTPDALIVINNLASLLSDYRNDAASLERAHELAQRLASLDVPQFKDTVGWVAYRRGDYRTALLNLEAAVDKLPELALARYHLAMTYAALKRAPDAKEQFAKAEALLKEGDPLKEKISGAVAALATPPAN